MLDIATPTLACRRYGTPAVVLGAGQRTTPELIASAAAHGVEVVKRDSGGGAVMTGPWMLGFSLRLAPSDPATEAAPLEIFRLLGAACRDVLGELGFAAALATDADVARSIERARSMNLQWACFGTVSHGELVDPAGRKLLGLAQCRRRGWVLLEGGLLLGEPDWALLCELFGKPARAGLALREATAPLAKRDGAEFDLKAFDAGLRRGVARYLSRPRGIRVL
ncbi:MAG TPA: ligase [Burkholderiales bacterium]|nr:ligase [Burkholderiales bacterium]